MLILMLDGYGGTGYREQGGTDDPKVSGKFLLTVVQRKTIMRARVESILRLLAFTGRYLLTRKSPPHEITRETKIKRENSIPKLPHFGLYNC